MSSRNASTHGLLQLVKTLNARGDRETGVAIRKHSEFSFAKACKVIEQTKIGDLGLNRHEFNRQEFHKYLCSFFDFESHELIRSVG
ncbi:hypothetical protein PINS_up015198, partial [Pythium insidiosum]